MTTLIWIIIAVIIITLIALILAEKRKTKLERKKISFKESFDLTNAPVITFLVGEKKLNFILDTGSTLSYVNRDIIESNQVPYEKVEGNINFFGIEGDSKKLEVVILKPKYRDLEFPNVFGVGDFTAAFDKFKKQEGITVHGLIGCDFFEAYKYIIDFSEFKVYPK